MSGFFRFVSVAEVVAAPRYTFGQRNIVLPDGISVSNIPTAVPDQQALRIFPERPGIDGGAPDDFQNRSEIDRWDSGAQVVFRDATYNELDIEVVLIQKSSSLAQLALATSGDGFITVSSYAGQNEWLSDAVHSLIIAALMARAAIAGGIETFDLTIFPQAAQITANLTRTEMRDLGGEFRDFLGVIATNVSTHRANMNAFLPADRAGLVAYDFSTGFPANPTV